MKRFFLSVLLVLLFGMALSTYSFASSGELNYRDDSASELNEATLKAVFEYFISIQNTFGNSTNGYLTNQIQTFYDNVDWNSFLSNIRNNLNENFGECQNLVFCCKYIDSNSFNLYILANNNTTGDLPYTRFYLDGNGWSYNRVYAKQFNVILNDDGSTTHQDLNNYIAKGYICFKSGAFNNNDYFSGQVFTDSSKKIVQVAGTQTADFGGILALSPTASFYTITSSDPKNYQWLIPTNYINLPSSTEIPDIPDEPNEPSGDEGGGTTGGNTGNITNPSGDTTGKVDLSGIESGIGAVKDAVNNVTNTIKDVFTFDSGDAKEVMEEFENTDLGLSQDLYDLNNQFFELFEKEEMDDFKISWNGVNYQEAQLIPSGEVNFSAMCRENEQLGKVKDYITLFAIVGASFTLLKVIWNMIAEMLGLNETLMETDFGDAVMYTYEDNEYDTNTRAYLDHHYYTKGGRRH